MMSARPSKTRQIALWTLVWAGLSSALACSGGAPTELPREPDRVVLVTIDTLRADHLPGYGHPLATAPFLSGLAEEGVSFHRAYAHSATTKPSHSSMFTSLYPLQHGVQSNGLVLDDEFVTMAEMFQAAGYRTAAFVSTDAPLGGNVNQGFETWDQHQANLDVEGGRKQYRQAKETIDAALAWLEDVGAEEDFFLWIHFYDPHKPIQPPEDAVLRVQQMIEGVGEETYRQELLSRGVPADTERGFEDATLYDAEIVYVDEQLSRLHDAFGLRGLLEDSLWVVTSDHGQGLGAHDWFGHSKQIYNAQLWVPLLFWWEGNTTPLHVRDRIAEHVDLLPTIAEIVGLEDRQIMPIQGRSLVPLLRGERVRDPKWFAFAERSRYADAGPQQQERGNYERGSRYALQDLEFKYILFTAGEDEFYRIAEDPDEKNNLIDDPEHADQREQMLAVLLQMVETMPKGREAQSVSEDEIERLRALGYIQ